MKKMVTLLMALSMVLAHAARAQDLTATVPFGFYTSNTMLPAGDYRLSDLDMKQVLMLRHSNGRDGVLAIAMPKSAKAENPRLVFTKYAEDRIFLSEVWSREKGLVLRKSKMERELVTTRLISGTNSPTTIVILAVRR